MYKCGHDFDRRDGCRTCAAGLQAQRNALLAAAKDIESKIMDFEAGRINWRADDFLFRVRAAIAAAESKEQVGA
jgi:hypothetical protein